MPAEKTASEENERANTSKALEILLNADGL